MTHALLPDLAGLRALARQVLEAHEAEDGPRLREVAALIADLLEDLSPCCERVPAERDHAQLRLLLADLRCLTHGYHAPEGSCATWRELWQRLAALEEALLHEIEAEQG